jgi:2-aminoadipate transaminase
MERIGGLLANRARTARSSAIRDLLHLLEQPGMRSLAGGLPAAEALPVDRFRVAFDRAVAAPGPYGPVALQYGATEGVAELRALVATKANATDGRTVTDEVLVTTGSQQAIDLLARVLVDPGDVVVTERPAYLGSLQAFAAAGATMHAVTTDEQGLRTDELEAALRAGLRPKLCSVVPNFQNPSGATLTSERRVHLAALAEHYGFVVVEDDPYRALRFDGPDLAPIRAHTDLAVTLGSTSKILAPGLRVGWAIAPPALLAPMVRAKQAADLHTSTTTQYVALDLLRDTAFLDAHVASLRARYAARCEALANALHTTLGDRAEFTVPDGGFFLWVRLPGVDTTSLLQRAIEERVAFVPGASFATDSSSDDQARLSFASLPPEDLVDAVARLARALDRTPAPALAHTGE